MQRVLGLLRSFLGAFTQVDEVVLFERWDPFGMFVRICLTADVFDTLSSRLLSASAQLGPLMHSMILLHDINPYICEEMWDERGSPDAVGVFLVKARLNRAIIVVACI